MVGWWNTDRIVSVLLITGALAASSSLTGNAARVVEFRLHAHFLAAPATVRMTIVVEPDPANRTLRVQIDGDNMFSSTEVALEGDAAKRFHDIQFKNVPEGHYFLQATVLSAAAVRGEARAELDVTP